MYNINIKYLSKNKLEIISDDNETCRNVLYIFQAEHIDVQPVKGMCVVIVYPYDWNRCMTPWTYTGADMKETGGGHEYLEDFVKNVIPEVEDGFEVINRGIAGYSLGGLEALYMSFNTDIFNFTGSVSGSFWYPDTISYFSSNRISKSIKNIYISLGDRECHTSNEERRSVLTNTTKIAGILAKESTVEFEMTKGGHFTNVSGKINKCIEYFRRII